MLKAAADVDPIARRGFAEAMMAETGATAGWGEFNVLLAAGMLREAAAMTTQIGGEVIPSDKPGRLAMAMRQPAGVVLGIAPWNAPVILGVRAIAMPLACGNTVVLKASELCPATHRLIGKALREAGLPDGVVNVVTNAPEDAGKVVEALIAHPAVRRINFTGSTRVGRIIAETAARYLKPVLLELGGKAPLVVLDDADLDAGGRTPRRSAPSSTRARSACRPSASWSTRRSPTSSSTSSPPRRARCRPAIRAKATSCSARWSTTDAVGAHARADRRRAGEGRASCVAGGEVDGTVMTATVLDHVTPAMRIYREESFGPVVSVIRAKDVDEAVRIANDTEYGLSAAVFGRDIARALEVAQAHRVRHLPHQRPDRARRGADAVRRRQGVGLRPLRRQGRDRRVHRAALDHDRDRAAAYPF